MGNKVRYFVIIACVIVIIANLFMADYTNFFGWRNLTPFISAFLIIISMSGSIWHVNKQREN